MFLFKLELIFTVFCAGRGGGGKEEMVNTPLAWLCYQPNDTVLLFKGFVLVFTILTQKLINFIMATCNEPKDTIRACFNAL